MIITVKVMTQDVIPWMEIQEPGAGQKVAELKGEGCGWNHLLGGNTWLNVRKTMSELQLHSYWDDMPQELVQALGEDVPVEEVELYDEFAFVPGQALMPVPGVYQPDTPERKEYGAKATVEIEAREKRPTPVVIIRITAESIQAAKDMWKSIRNRTLAPNLNFGA